MHSELFGAPLPNDWMGWLGAFVAVLGGVGVMQAGIAAFIELHQGEEFRLQISGHVLPTSWAIWGFCFIYAEPETLPVLIVLVGGFAQLVAAVLLRRSRRQSPGSSGGGGP